MRQRQRKVMATCSRHGRGGSSAEVADLKHQSHGGVQRYALITGQSQHLTGQKIFTQ